MVPRPFAVAPWPMAVVILSGYSTSEKLKLSPKSSCDRKTISAYAMGHLGANSSGKQGWRVWRRRLSKRTVLLARLLMLLFPLLAGIVLVQLLFCIPARLDSAPWGSLCLLRQDSSATRKGGCTKPQPEVLELESRLMQSEYGLYPLCQPHDVVVTRWQAARIKSEAKARKGKDSQKNSTTSNHGSQPFPPSGISAVYPASLPNLPYMRDRYVRMYGHWRLAISRLRAQLVQAGEPPYVRPPSRHFKSRKGGPNNATEDFGELLAQAAQAAGFQLLGGHAGAISQAAEQRSSVLSNGSLWANERSSLQGFCSFARSLATSAGEIIKAAEYPKLLLLDGGLVHLGLNGLNGTPQGDIMQWTDLLIALHLIGYGPAIDFPLEHSPCPDIAAHDLVFSDYAGLTCPKCCYREKFMRGAPFAERCKIRLLDLFGTQEPYNLGRHKGDYGHLKLPSLRQFLTLQPEYAPENTFLGIVSPLPIEPKRFWAPSANSSTSGNATLPPLASPQSEKENSTEGLPTEREWKGLVWGKGKYYFTSKEMAGARYKVQRYLSKVSTHMPLVATAPTKDRYSIPFFVEITGKLPKPAEFSAMLSRFSVVVGLGIPLMPAGLLEVVTNPGLRLLMPKFNPPWRTGMNGAMKDKPTDQGLTSQSPFLEHALGRPFVYTVDPADDSALEEALLSMRQDFTFLQNMTGEERQKVLDQRQATALRALEPFYSAESMLIRVQNIVLGHGGCFGEPPQEISHSAGEDPLNLQAYPPLEAEDMVVVIPPVQRQDPKQARRPHLGTFQFPPHFPFKSEEVRNRMARMGFVPSQRDSVMDVSSDYDAFLNKLFPSGGNRQVPDQPIPFPTNLRNRQVYLESVCGTRQTPEAGHRYPLDALCKHLRKQWERDHVPGALASATGFSQAAGDAAQPQASAQLPTDPATLAGPDQAVGQEGVLLIKGGGQESQLQSAPQKDGKEVAPNAAVNPLLVPIPVLHEGPSALAVEFSQGRDTSVAAMLASSGEDSSEEPFLDLLDLNSRRAPAGSLVQEQPSLSEEDDQGFAPSEALSSSEPPKWRPFVPTTEQVTTPRFNFNQRPATSSESRDKLPTVQTLDEGLAPSQDSQP